jgi:ABC-type Fe3+/spermidine/putrescine transport system ATPase subunit
VAPCLRLRGVTRRFAGGGGVAAASFDLNPGECLVLVGPSGSGKTTLLRLIAGLDRPDEGEIWFEDQRVAGAGRNIVPPGDRRVGFVFQDLALWPHLTVCEQLDFVLRSTGVDRSDRPGRITDILSLCRITSTLARRHPHELSVGEQQRAALARTLVGSPRLLLLDEPFSSLDPELRVALRAELASLQRQLHLPTIAVTHDREDAAALADRTAFVRGGCIETITPKSSGT